ncbi:MAG: hypothetical protein E7535_07680 [Ruminococcaceae bacterium]|nr:hypothetical protein [Oscillospiraceae bacterium]
MYRIKSAFFDIIIIMVLLIPFCFCATLSESENETENNSEATVQYDEISSVSEKMVWIPVKGGRKYHSYADCSQMHTPVRITEEEAVAAGFDACMKCIDSD